MKRSSRYRAAVKELHETVDLYLRLILINAKFKNIDNKIENLKKNIDKDLGITRL
jgi:hypothetical protein